MDDTTLTVRPLAASDELDELEPVWADSLSPSDAAQASLSLVAERREGLAGLALGRETAAGQRIEALFVPREASRPVLVGRVLAAIAQSRPDKRIEILARQADEHLEPAARQAGFRPIARYVNVRGSLQAVSRPRYRPFTFRPYHEVGRRGMLAVLSEIWSGGPGPRGLTAGLELAHFLDLTRTCGEVADTSLWRVAYYRGELAGAVLGLRLAENPATGILIYIGLVPCRRGHGLGAALHAEALWSLRAGGVEGYEDSTEADNLAMRRIFARAGCEEVACSVLFVRPGAVEVGPEPSPRLRLGSHISLLRKVPCTKRQPSNV